MHFEECHCNHEDDSEWSFASRPTVIFFTWCLNTRYIFKDGETLCILHRPGMAQRVGRGIALLFHDRGIRRG